MIQTLVFIDFETTNLFDDCYLDPALNPRRIQESSIGRTKRLQMLIRTDSKRTPKVTEMSLMAISRSDFIMGYQKMHFRFSQLDPGLERIDPIKANVDFYVKRINPDFSEKEWDKYEKNRQRTTDIKLLSKSDLLDNNTFYYEWLEALNFLQLLPKPICLIAHNGVNFDFRLLYHELRNANLLGTIPADQFRFLDTLPFVYEFEKECRKIGNVSSSIVTDGWSPAKLRIVNSLRQKLHGKGRFKLGNMYRKIFTQSLEFHNAKMDTYALMQICLSYGSDFMEYLDKENSLFPLCFHQLIY